MEVVKKTDEYTIIKKRSGRYGVRSNIGRNWINGPEKAAILNAEKLIEAPQAKVIESSEKEPGDSADASDTSNTSDTSDSSEKEGPSVSDEKSSEVQV